MREEVLSIVVSVLGLYLASLAFSFQQIADNLTYKLIKPYTQKSVWWFLLFASLIVIASWSVYCGDRDCGNRLLNGDAISWIVKVASIGLVTFLSWNLFNQVFNFEADIAGNLMKLVPDIADEVVLSILTVSLANREFGRVQNIITSAEGTALQPAVLQWLDENLEDFSNEKLEGRIVNGLLRQMRTAPTDPLLMFLEHFILRSPRKEKGNEVAIALVEDLKSKTYTSQWDLKVLKMLLQDHSRFKDITLVTKTLETV